MRGSAWILTAAGAAMFAAASAHADELSTGDVLLGRAGDLGRQLVLKLDVFSFDDDVRPALLPGVGFDAGLDVDLRGRRAHMRMGAGDPNVFYVHFDTRVWSEGGGARTSVVLQVAVAGGKLQLSLPDVRLRSQSVAGQTAVVLDVPLIEGRF